MHGEGKQRSLWYDPNTPQSVKQQLNENAGWPEVWSLGAKTDWLIAAGAYPGFCSMKRLEVFLLPLDGMLVHHRSLSRNLLSFPNNLPVPIYTPGWREALHVRVKCFAQEHNTMSPGPRARTRTAHSGVERTNHEVTAPPTLDLSWSLLKFGSSN